MKKPNLFICGSPRAGTTSLHNDLGKHPEIFMSPDKEPTYFAKDILKKPKYKNEREYLELFKKSNNEKILGEASTTYFVSDEAPKEIKKFNANAKILIMTRDKFEVLHSFFYQRVHGGTSERIDDFERWYVERLIKKNSDFPVWKLLDQKEQIEKYRKKFGKNLLIVRLEDYEENPEKEYKKILRFLDVKDKNFVPEFKKLNSRKEYKSEKLRKTYYYLTKAGIHRIVPKKIKKKIGKKMKRKK